MHASINSRLGKWDVRESKVKDMASAVCWLPRHTNVVHRGVSSPPGEPYAAAGCGNRRLEGFVSNVKVPSYNAVLGGRKVRNVLEYVRGKWLSVAVEYRDSVHDSPQQVWVIEALSSLEL
jgi:RPA family protein